MNQKWTGRAGILSQFAPRLAAAVTLLFCASLECRPQSPGIRNAISGLQSSQIQISELDWRLMKLNVSRAYEKHDDYSAQPVTYDNRQQRFTTGFFVPANSPVLGSTSKNQIEQFEVEVNGLRLMLIGMLRLSDSFLDKIGLFVEADFVTYEAPDFVVIGRYRDGKIQLVHEKLKASK